HPIKNLQIPIPHRPPLNLLTHLLDKPYQIIISQFIHTDPIKFLPQHTTLQLTSPSTGHLKYHLHRVKTTDS
ncbi:hypothetical protein, partial [Staphylococcus capitis]|uniref:hypothetical protein n=1 Tax=Staphylococcus capitis TaxID=29388 RepID=UPI001C92F7BF